MNYHQSLRTFAGSETKGRQGNQHKEQQLAGELIRVDAVTVDQRDQMFELMSRYYDNMCRESFDQDFDEKDWVIVAVDPTSHQIMGFSTQLLINVTHTDGGALTRPQKVLFSGDTIIDRAYWARNPLAQLWGRLSLTLIDEYPDHDLFWFLISKGFRTYRFLPVFFKEFFPRCDVETPVWAADLIVELATERYPALFDSESGIVRASEFGCKLREGIADITPERLENKHVSFFHRRNPGHVIGDELCCLARLSQENFKRGAYRVIGDSKAIEL